MKLKRLSTGIAAVLGASAISAAPAQGDVKMTPGAAASATDVSSAAATVYIWKNR